MIIANFYKSYIHNKQITERNTKINYEKQHLKRSKNFVLKDSNNCGPLWVYELETK